MAPAPGPGCFLVVFGPRLFLKQRSHSANVKGASVTRARSSPPAWVYGHESPREAMGWGQAAQGTNPRAGELSGPPSWPPGEMCWGSTLITSGDDFLYGVYAANFHRTLQNGVQL